MKNKEKFAKEIVEIACSGDVLAVSKVTGKPISCKNTRCEYCNRCNDFPICEEKRLREWAESEYIENPVISKRDRAFLDYIGERAEWMTKDCDGEISVWTTKPKKLVNLCAWMDGLYNCLSMSNIDFPMVKWSDAEPWKIEDLKKLEVVDEY